VLRRRVSARKKRKRTDDLTPAELAERERLREQQSPFRARWGFFPK
jgi:hypothetical protein